MAKSEADEIRELQALLLKFGYLSAPRTTGCSEETIRELDRYAASGRLPELYRQFLLAMGGYLDGTYMGSYLFTCDYLDEIQVEGHAMAQHYEILVPPDAYFFATFDFVDYFYFRTHEPDDNPPVYMCGSHRQPLLLYKSLRAFFRAEMGEEEEE